MRSKQRLFTENCGRIEICLTIVITQKTVLFTAQKRKKVIGKMKNEVAGIPITEFIGVKGVRKSVIKRIDYHS